MKDSLIGKLLIKGPTRHGLYVLPTIFVSSQAPTHRALSTVCTSSSTWHAQLGHLAMQLVHKLLHQLDLPIIKATTSSLCFACYQAKSHQRPYPSLQSTSNAPLQLLFTNIWGLAPTLSRGGFRYYVSFVDDFSYFT